jgi:hypothetical protein
MGSKRRQGPRTSEGTGMWVLLLVAIGVFVLLMAGGTQEPMPHAKTMDKPKAPVIDLALTNLKDGIKKILDKPVQGKKV